MSCYKDIIVLKEVKEGDCSSPELTGDYICELLEHKNRNISGVEKLTLDAKNMEDVIGKYCNILNNNTIQFSYKHYNNVFLPLWNRFKKTIESYTFEDFTSEEGVTSIVFENAYSPNIIFFDKFNCEYGVSLEDFMRSPYFGCSKKYQVISLWSHHE